MHLVEGKIIFFCFVCVFVTSCVKLKSIALTKKDKPLPKNTLLLGKELIRKGKFSKAKEEFDNLLLSFLSPKEASEAMLYSALIDLHTSDSMGENSKVQGIGGGKDGFIELKNLIVLLKAKLEKEQQSLVSARKTVDSYQRKIKQLSEQSLAFRSMLDKAKKELLNLRGLNSLLSLRARKHKAEEQVYKHEIGSLKDKLEKLKRNFQKMQEIELKKEKMERELRELAP